MKTKELAITLFEHCEKRGNNFFICYKQAQALELEAQSITAVPDPKILRSNFDKLIDYLAETMPHGELLDFKGRASLAVAECKRRWQEATKPVVYNQAAVKTLRELFGRIGWQDELEEALKEECAKAYLHGYVDSAYDEWESAGDFVCILFEEKEGDVELADLCERWPNIIFREDSEWGLQYARGRLFSLMDYQQAKEAIASLGKDLFSKKYEGIFREEPKEFNHLFE